MVSNVGSMNAGNISNAANQAKEGLQAFKANASERKAALSETKDVLIQNISNAADQAYDKVVNMQELFAQDPEAFVEALADAAEEALSQVFTVDNQLEENGTITVTNHMTGHETAGEVDYDLRSGEIDASVVNTRGGQANVSYNTRSGEFSIAIAGQNGHTIDIEGSAKGESVSLEYQTSFGVQGTLNGSLDEGLTINGANGTWQLGGKADLLA